MESFALSVILNCCFIIAIVIEFFLIKYLHKFKENDEAIIEDLERENRKLEIENDQYKSQVTTLITEVEVLTDISEKIPEGCTKGPWCKGCDFVKTFYVPTGSVGIHSAYTHKERYACGKGASCAHYVGHTEEN